MVGDPEPGVLEVDTGGVLGGVEEEVGADAGGVGTVGDSGVLGAFVGLQVGACSAANTEVHIPETRGTLSRLEVPLHHDCARSGALSLEHEVLHLDSARLTGLADLPESPGVALVTEERAGGHDERPVLTDDLDVGRDDDSRGNDVGTMVNVEDLTGGDAGHGLLESGSVISNSVTDSAEGANGDEVADSDVGVLRLGASEELAGGVEEGGGLGRSRVATLDTAASGGLVVATLGPRLDDSVTGKDGTSVGVLDGDGNVGGHVDVVQDEGATSVGHRGRVHSPGSLDTDGSVADLGVHENDRADGLVGRAIGHVDGDAAVVDGDTSDGPSPVPVHEDGCLDVVELHVAGSELLAAVESTVLTTVEGQVRHEATGSVIHEDTELLGSGAGNHVEDNVLEGGGLGSLPVDTSTRGLRHGGQVDLEVADLTEEVVLVGEPVVAVGIVWVRVDDSHALEAGSSLEGRWVHGIANELGVVVLDDRLADEVGTRREVDNGGGDSGRVASLTAAASGGDGVVDGISRVPRTSWVGTKVSDDVTVELVSGRSKVGGALTLDIGKPEGGCLTSILARLLDGSGSGSVRRGDWGGDSSRGEEESSDERNKGSALECEHDEGFV